MKVKYIIGAVLILALGYEIYRIEKQLSVVTLEIRKTDRATITIPSLAPASTFDNADLFIVADGGTVSRKLAGSQITGAIHDTATTLRGEMGTAGSGIPGTVGNKQIAIGLTGDSLTSDADFKVDTDSLVTKHVAIHGDIYWKKLTGLSGNYALIWNGSTQKADTASLTPAAKGWIAPLGFWPKRYLISRDSMALPLPNRAGIELRKVDPGEGTYQIEYELEMVNRGLWQLWCITILWLSVLTAGLLYVILRKK